MTSSDVAIRVEGLGKMYRMYDRPADRLKQMLWGRHTQAGYGREFWALRDFSCTVRKGEMLGVIGRNGSGKSTLLQMLAGTLSPTIGTVQFSGRVSALLELGSGFNPDYTGRDNVFIAGAILGISAEEMRRRFDAIVDFAGIGDFLDQPVKTYSSGMAVRLAFAVASSIDPDILIVDEALAVGDMVFQQKCFHRFREIREAGASVVFVTHDLGSITQYCDRAAVLARGQVIGAGAPKDMVDLYKKSMAEELRPDDGARQQGYGAGFNASARLNEHFPKSPNCQEYGDGAATIVDWGMLDGHGLPLRINHGGNPLRIVVVVHFNQPCSDPIVAFTVRDLKGNDLCGTNTLYERSPLGAMRGGETVTVSFTLSLPLQPGATSLCIGCTEYTGQALAVHHRLYDVTLIESAPDRQFTGVFDGQPRVEIIRHA